MTKTIDNIKYFWADLPQWAKGIALVAIIGIPSYIGYNIYKNKQDEKARLKALEDTKKSEEELKRLADSGINPTMTETDFKQITDTILNAFAGCDPSLNAFGILHSPNKLENAKTKSYYTDSGQSVFNFVDKIANDADFISMIMYWGQRKYQDCFEVGEWAGSITTATFTAAVNKELDQNEIQALNTFLASKGITKRFY
jgi:hypothetical protein